MGTILLYYTVGDNRERNFFDPVYKFPCGAKTYVPLEVFELVLRLPLPHKELTRVINSPPCSENCFVCNSLASDTPLSFAPTFDWR